MNNIKTWWNTNCNKIIRNFCLILIIGIVTIDLFPSWFNTIHAFINGSIFNEKELLSLTDKVVSVHSKLLTLGFLLAVFLIIKKRITLIHFSVILFASWFLNIYELMDESIHPLIMNTGIFSHFLRSGSTELNPQYTRLTLFLLATIILFILSYRSKTRTIDRSFILLINLSMIVTTFIFHLVIPMGILKYTKEERMNTYVSNIQEFPIDFFCKNKTCIFFDKEFKEKEEKFIGDRNLFEQHNGFVNYSKEFFKNKENLDYPVYGNAGDFVGSTSIFQICILKDEEFVCAFDNKAMKNYGILAKAIFAFLVSIAHGVWIFGGLLLLAMHKTRAIKKIAHGTNNAN